jgi:hypothetical protein
MSNKVRAASRFVLCAVLCLCPLACKRSTDRSSEISAILKGQGVLVTNSLPTVVCRKITLKRDGNGFTIFVEGGSFADVRSFLEVALGDAGIDLGKDIDGFETAAFHKSASHPGFLMQAKPKGIELIGIK